MGRTLWEDGETDKTLKSGKGFVLKSLIMKRSTEAVRNAKNAKSIKTHTNKLQFYQSHRNVTEIKAVFSASRRVFTPK